MGIPSPAVHSRLTSPVASWSPSAWAPRSRSEKTRRRCLLDTSLSAKRPTAFPTPTRCSSTRRWPERQYSSLTCRRRRQRAGPGRPGAEAGEPTDLAMVALQCADAPEAEALTSFFSSGTPPGGCAPAEGVSVAVTENEKPLSGSPFTTDADGTLAVRVGEGSAVEVKEDPKSLPPGTSRSPRRPTAFLTPTRCNSTRPRLRRPCSSSMCRPRSPPG